MKSPIGSSWLIPSCLAAGAVCLLGVMLTFHSAPSASASEQRGGKPDGDDRVPLAVARERAALAHLIYSATMDVIHRHYFRKGQPVLPARAMEDVFAEVAEQSKVEGRWIAVNTKAMSIHHEPKTEFEKQAASAIAAGQEQFELVGKGYYRSARAIPLSEGCVNCHTGMFRSPAKSPSYAGLVISIPIK